MERGVHILLGVTGSVAAIKAKQLVQLLQEPKSENVRIEVKVVATENALHFFSLEELKEVAPVYRDDDEWKTWKKIPDPVLHIELRKWADIMVVAPLDANTMAKLAGGICDNLLTCVVRAWDSKKPLFFCPAMNTHMWEHPVTQEHVKKLKSFGYKEIPCISKKLACGDVGFGGMAEVPTIAKAVRNQINLK
ncbi:phosphopantothenoylcysteine decarboxylase isoform X2 [Centruroides vittatus]